LGQKQNYTSQNFKRNAAGMNKTHRETPKYVVVSNEMMSIANSREEA
jgi:hypothetical protein